MSDSNFEASSRFTTAMVIDDSAVQREHACSICSKLGLAVVDQAVNGQDALQRIVRLQVPPDLLLIDIEMPIMDGVSLIQKLSEKRIQSHILILSSREISLISSVEAMVKAYGLPVVGALPKPLLFEQLQRLIKRYESKAPLNPIPQRVQINPTITQDDLERAVTGRQFVVYFQPKVFIESGLLKGVEALVRWKHPEHGIVPPNDFIPLAESSGLIHEITLQILDLSLYWQKFWCDHGLNLTVSVNLSATSLSDIYFSEKICQRVLASKIPPHNIIFEITETAVMSNLAPSLNTLAKFRLVGFGLSIDDYGTGFSSMQQLARIPFTELKIDRSFVDGASESSQLEDMVSISIDTCKRLNLASVAEGIEAIDDWNLLKRLGCNIGQGYLIAKPMPGGELVGWIKLNSNRIKNLS